MSNFFNSIVKQLFIISFIVFLAFSFATFGTITANAQDAKGGIAFLQPSGLKCIFYIDSKTSPSAKNPEGCTEKTSLVVIVQEFLIAIAPFVTTLLIIFGGYEYFVDNEAKKTSAKSTIIAAISGYIIIILAPKIAEIIRKTFSGTENVVDPAALQKLLTEIIDVLINLSSIVAVVCIVLSGYAYFLQFFINSGKQEGKMNGRELLIAGITGLIVTTLAKPIVGFIQKLVLPVNSGTGDISLTVQKNFVIDLITVVVGNFLIPFASLATVVLIIISAYLWLTAFSDETKVKNARSTLNAALIGLVIVLLSTTIVQLIIYFIPRGDFKTGSSNGNSVITTPDPLRQGAGNGSNSTPVRNPVRTVN